MNGHDAGGFSVDELLGHDLGVIWSLDEQIIGRELLEAARTTTHTQGSPAESAAGIA